ncbi:response regulator transcription factor [Cytophagales bacterium RKSG123]|nr:response regulator transcription factor [Xanthovirga aplysinae]
MLTDHNCLKGENDTSCGLLSQLGKESLNEQIKNFIEACRYPSVNLVAYTYLKNVEQELKSSPAFYDNLLKKVQRSPGVNSQYASQFEWELSWLKAGFWGRFLIIIKRYSCYFVGGLIFFILSLAAYIFMLRKELFLAKNYQDFACCKMNDQSWTQIREKLCLAKENTTMPNKVDRLNFQSSLKKSALDKSSATPIENQELEQVNTKLTPREKQILILIQENCSNKEIADRLFIEVTTVKSHLGKIYNKLNIKNRTEALKFAKLIDNTSSN